MYKRLAVLSIVILAAVFALTLLGYHAVQKWSQSLEGARLGEFAEVAEQIRQDIKRKLDEFIRAEQQRPYSDYLYFYVPENIADAQQLPLLRSPLADQLEQGLAYGYFQIEPDGQIVTPYYRADQSQTGGENARRAKDYLDNVEHNLLPALGSSPAAFRAPLKERPAPTPAEPQKSDSSTQSAKGKSAEDEPQGKGQVRSKAYPIESLQAQSQQPMTLTQQRLVAASNVSQQTEQPSQQADTDVQVQRRRYAPRAQPQQQSVTGSPQEFQAREKTLGDNQPPALRVIERPAPRGVEGSSLRGIEGSVSSGIEGPVSAAVGQSTPSRAEDAKSTQTAAPVDRMTAADSLQSGGLGYRGSGAGSYEMRPQTPQPQQPAPRSNQPAGGSGRAQDETASETVQIRIEPFVPVVVSAEVNEQSVFGGQVFLLRHVRIEDRHILQGFRLNEERLIEQVKDSAQTFMRDGMTFGLAQAAASDALSQKRNGGPAYTAILDFGFGGLVLNLKETDPARIVTQISQLRTLYFGTTATVVIVVVLALASLWHNVAAQVRLAQRKDEFISAVSHELRTPLTSIRMYAEMLEKNWVRSQDKLSEYYTTVRHESERLSRLIENVLDFSRIQKGKKEFAFKLGDLNLCITDVVEMMRPYAARYGFAINTDLVPLAPTSFDKDAVTQIIVNLLDNAVKYARTAEDKTITVRTKNQGRFTVIEIEDHGPGVPHHRRKKIFDQFYHYGCEPSGSGRNPAAVPSTGTGLGLTLVKKFADAHNGFVEVVSAHPTGAIFRVGLPSPA